MQVFDNTTVKQIADHLASYAGWIARLKGGTPNLSDILIISDTEYQQFIGANEVIASDQFRQRTIRVAQAVPQARAAGDAPQAARPLSANVIRTKDSSLDFHGQLFA